MARVVCINHRPLFILPARLALHYPRATTTFNSLIAHADERTDRDRRNEETTSTRDFSSINYLRFLRGVLTPGRWLRRARRAQTPRSKILSAINIHKTLAFLVFTRDLLVSWGSRPRRFVSRKDRVFTSGAEHATTLAAENEGLPRACLALQLNYKKSYVDLRCETNRIGLHFVRGKHVPWLSNESSAADRSSGNCRWK